MKENLKKVQAERFTKTKAFTRYWTDVESKWIVGDEIISIYREALGRHRHDPSKACRSPIDPSVLLNNNNSIPLDASQLTMYRSIIGSLTYLATRTRLDLGVSTRLLAFYLLAPTKGHMRCAKCTLRYMRETSIREFLLRPGSSDQMKPYVSAGWVNGSGWNRRSRTGSIITYGDAVNAFISTLQKCVSLSSTGAEYVVLSETTKTIVWLRDVLSKQRLNKSTKVF